MKTKKQRIDRWETIIKTIVSDYQRLSDACDAANRAGCLDSNGPLFDAIWKAHGTLIGAIEGDGWIDWHLYENDCGKLGKEAGFDGKLTPIRTARHLAKLIVESEERNKP